MKASLLCLVFTATWGLYSSAPALAQTADTTSAWRYLPLQVGNVWEYGSWVEECYGGIDFCEVRLIGYVRWEAEGEWTVADTTYTVLRMRGYTAEGEGGASRRLAVRFDTAEAHGFQRYDDGTEVAWPNGLRVSPQMPRLSTEADCGGQGPGGVFVHQPGEVVVRVEGEPQTRISKEFQSLIPGWYFAADVGLLYAGGAEFGGEWINLTFAKVGKVEYGTEQFPVAAESAPLEAAFALAVFPNPTRDVATVRFTLDAPQRVTLAVYDVLGRRVLAADLGAQPTGEATHRLDVANLPAGLYVVRLTGDAGARATARIVRN